MQYNTIVRLVHFISMNKLQCSGHFSIQYSFYAMYTVSFAQNMGTLPKRLLNGHLTCPILPFLWFLEQWTIRTYEMLGS